ncbi:MAG: beta-glucosidase [Phenylobacterium sp.]|uniref:glycoside hydrolase family 3 N-terminal domain-containing protein n=1 Tax=Phenylobacterium sp. TaxID=1871053 RepID=UPI002621C7B9|nr:glycoside hydrolase family 3 N-terminal domain-containing protein [Phenylobacterium sp.]MDB5499680.1 beta-glucosidase [Phenylobacterium sp.]
MGKDRHFLDQLLSRMTLEEKVGQLSLYSADVKLAGAETVNPALTFKAPESRFDDIRAGRVTGVFNGYGEDYVRSLQKIAVEQSRLGIPLIFGADVIHGFRTAFPVPLAEAASFEPELAERVAETAAAEAAAEGLHWTFAPGADLCRDARWGRVVESYGEDVLVASRFAAARVRGFQGGDLSDPRRLMATVKHFAAYGAAEAGLDYNTAEISRTTLIDHYLPPYRAAVDAGAGAVMTAFNDVDGVPASANRELLTGLLRDRWGFEGFVVSDYNSDFETVAHGLADSPREAARLCFLAGLDMCMQSGLYADHLPGLVASGEVEEGAVDRAVLRVLRAKQALGLFENPYRGLGRAFDPAPARALAREAARRCQVLLKNADGVLPLKAGMRVALIGPFAREHQHLNGAWAIFAANGLSVNLEEGFLAALGPDALVVEPGCGIAEPIAGGLDDAAAAARSADVVLLALGEGQHMSGESRSRSDIGLPPAQLDLARAVKQAGKPVVTLLRTGRPLAIPELAELSDALLVTWFLGAETGAAVADVVLGRAAPSGRLPMSFPRRVGQAPIYYARKPTGRPPQHPPGPFTARYIDVEPTPLYPFGYGLGYGRVEYGPTQVSVAELGWSETLSVSCELVETAGAAIEEVVQLYIRDVAASRIRPVRELKDFRKVAIAGGARVVVAFELQTADLRFAGEDGALIVEPGAFDVWVAPHAQAGVPARFVLLDRHGAEPPGVG